MKGIGLNAGLLSSHIIRLLFIIGIGSSKQFPVGVGFGGWMGSVNTSGIYQLCWHFLCQVELSIELVVFVDSILDYRPHGSANVNLFLFLYGMFLCVLEFQFLRYCNRINLAIRSEEHTSELQSQR